MGKAPRKVGKNNWGQKTKRNKYMTRADAMKYLQLNIGDFRRLCILKGIHPKQPSKTQFKNKSKLNTDKPLHKGKLYYYKKDIKFMAHDPLVIRFREWKVFLKRMKRAEAHKDESQIKSLNTFAKPKFTYDHLVKERYPTFQAALNDLDDCLTLMFMFNYLPSGYGGIEPHQLQLVKRLCDEFCTYVAKKKLLRKCFLSFKGIYYQAEIWGQKVTWIVPFGYTQTIPQEADFKIFKTFLTFYTTLMTFINYKLYHDEGIQYPPTVEDYTPSLKSFLIPALLTSSQGTKAPVVTTNNAEDKQKHEQRQQEISNLLKKSSANNGNEMVDEELDDMVNREEQEQQRHKPQTVDEIFFDKFTNMFKNMTFFISRECPVSAVEFVLSSFGGRATTDEDDVKKGRITHYILDRPAIPATVNKDSCEFVQPQWAFDCVNAKILIPLDKYRPGEKLPPHLSPFEDDDSQKQVKYATDGSAYEPEYAKELRRMVDSELASIRRLQRRQGGSGTEDDRGIIGSVAVGIGADVPQTVYSDDEEAEDVLLDEENSEDEEEIYAREIEMEKTGMKFSDFQKKVEEEKKEKEISLIKSGKMAKSKKQLKEEEETLLRKTMMSRNKQKLYEHEMKKIKQAQKKSLDLQKKRIAIAEQESEKQKEEKATPNVVIQRDAVDSDDEDAQEYEHVVEVKQEKRDIKSQNTMPAKKIDMDKDEDFDVSQFTPVDDSDDDDDDLLDVIEEEEQKPAVVEKQSTQKKAAGKATTANNKQKGDNNKKQKNNNSSNNNNASKSKKRPAPTKSKQPNKKMRTK